MSFAQMVPIEKALLEKYAHIKLPADFQGAYLKSYDAIKNFIEYDIMWEQGGKLYNAGNISVSRHSIDAYVKNKKDEIYKLKGSYWERQINIFDDKKPNTERYSRYGLTMAALYKFTEQLEQNSIDKTLSIIKEDNIASLKFSQKFLGVANRLRVVEEEINAFGKTVYKEQPVFIYETPVKETLAKLDAYATPSHPQFAVKKVVGASR